MYEQSLFTPRHLGAYIKAVGTLMIKYNVSGEKCEDLYREEITQLMLQEGISLEAASCKLKASLCLD